MPENKTIVLNLIQFALCKIQYKSSLPPSTLLVIYLHLVVLKNDIYFTPLPEVSLKFALIWAVNDIIFPMGSDFSRSSLECVSLDSQQSSANKEQTSIWSNSNDLPESIVCCSLHTHSTECPIIEDPLSYGFIFGIKYLLIFASQVHISQKWNTL